MASGDALGDLLVRLQHADEAACWLTLGSALDELGVPSSGVAVYHCADGSAPVRVAGGAPSGPHVGPAGELAGAVTAEAGSARAYLTGIPGAADEDRTVPLLAVALSAHTAARNARLLAEQALLHERVIRSWVHGIRGDLSTLNAIGGAAISGALDEPVDEYQAAVNDAAAHSERLLSDISLTVYATRPEPPRTAVDLGGLLTAAHRDRHGRRPAPELTLPAGETPHVFASQRAAEGITAAVLDAVYALTPEHDPGDRGRGASRRLGGPAAARDRQAVHVGAGGARRAGSCRAVDQSARRPSLGLRGGAGARVHVAGGAPSNTRLLARAGRPPAP